jgi:protein SCO1/2
MTRFARIVLPLLLVLPLAASASPALKSTALKSGEFSPPRAAPELDLQGSNGKPLRLADFRGKVVALGFGFTSCPAVCPTTLADLAAVKTRLGARGKDFQVVYVTVDPERDTAERMRVWLAAFDPGFVGGTGSASQLAAVRKQYGITATRTGAGAHYGFNHSSFVYLIDKAGKLRALSPYGRAVDDVVHDVRALLDN